MASKGNPNIFVRFSQSIQRLYHETIGELHKVSWPTRREAIKLTRIVLAVLLFMTAVLGSLDYLYSKLFAILLNA